VDVTINAISEVQQEAAIEVNNEELQPHFAKAYEKFRPKAQLRGFRKGKVPLGMIKKLYGEAIEHDALDLIAEEVYRKAMEERNIRPLGQPAMVDMNFKRGASFRFTVKYDVRPNVTLKDYKGLRIEKPVHPFTDQELEDELLHLRRANSTQTPATVVTDQDYIVTADLQEVDEAGTPLIGKKSENMKFRLYDTSLAPEIRTTLRSAQVGGTYPVDVESKHEDHARHNRYRLTVTAIEKVELPALDETLVRKLTGEKTTDVQEFKQSLRDDLNRYWQEQSAAQVRDAIADEIVRTHEFPVPESLVNGFLDSFVEDIKSRSRTGALPKDFDEKKFRAENRANAVWQAKWMLLKEGIAAAEHIELTDEELDAMATLEATRIGLDKERLMQYYRGSSTAKEKLLSDKILTFLVNNARITEKVVEPASGHQG